MNIKQHIEAGHYPKDEKGRALVPCRCGYRTATVAATDAPGEWVIQGWWQRNDSTSATQQSWFADGRLGIPGRNTSPHEDDLLPPPPRKVKVTGWALYKGDQFWTWYATEERARKCCHPDERVIQLTGEYEEPWS